MDNMTLFGQVKRKLNITWDDADTTARLEEIIESAIPTLKHKLGIFDSEFDFSAEGTERMLFVNYCLYEWNHCVNEFDANYFNDIAQVQAKWAVKYAEEGAGNEE
jgi:hypothetical protein